MELEPFWHHFWSFTFFELFYQKLRFPLEKIYFFPKKAISLEWIWLKKWTKIALSLLWIWFSVKKTLLALKKKNEYPKSSIVFFDGSTKFILVNLIFEFQASTFNFLRLPKYAVGLNPRLKAPSCRNSLLYFEWVHQIYDSKFDFWISKNPKLLITP